MVENSISTGAGWLSILLLKLPILATESSRLSSVEKSALLSCVCVAAAAAALLKQRRLVDYAMVEIFFGVGVAASVIWARMGTDPVVNGLTLMAAAFILSRGWGNFHDDFQKHQAALV